MKFNPNVSTEYLPSSIMTGKILFKNDQIDDKKIAEIDEELFYQICGYDDSNFFFRSPSVYKQVKITSEELEELIQGLLVDPATNYLFYYNQELDTIYEIYEDFYNGFEQFIQDYNQELTLMETTYNLYSKSYVAIDENSSEDEIENYQNYLNLWKRINSPQTRLTVRVRNDED